jgi:predicted alpha/beta-hydrolase family hydrolase
MQIIKDKVDISDSIGSVSTVTMLPEQPTHLLILGHGAGADMNHRFMEGLAHSLASNNLATLRYNFPYMENRKGRPDIPAVAHKTIEQVVKTSHLQYPKLPLVLSGKSFGGRMASQTMAKFQLPSIKGLVLYGFPLHAPAKPGIDRAEHLYEVKVPMLFLQGDKDSLAHLDLLQPLLKKLKLATLKIYEGADHSFKFSKKSGISEGDVFNMLAEDTVEFCRKL